MLKVTLPYIVQVPRVIVSKLPREPSVQKVVLEFERTMWSATREVLSGVQITQCTFHFHPTLTGPILDLKRDQAEFCLISQIVRQVWWVRAIARPAPGQLKVRQKKTKTIRQMAARRAKGSSKPMGKTSLLERKDARKMWEEISRELNRKFGTKRTSDQCKKKMNYLIEL